MTFMHKLSARLARVRSAVVILLLGAIACTDHSVSAPSGTDLSRSALVTTFLSGDRVQTTGTANVRSGPRASATLLGSQPIGASGTLLGGPIVDSTGDKLTRYNVDFDSGVDGWVAQEYALLTLLTPAPPPSVASVAVSPKPAAVYISKTVQLTAVAKDSAGTTLTGASMTWLSRDTLKAKVSATGLVTGVALGTVYVVATSGTASDSSAVTVSKIPVASVVVSPATASVLTGATVQLTATPKDSAGGTLTGRTIGWASSNVAVATVSASGLVTGVAAGSTTITATSEGKNGSATVTVTTATVSH